MNLAVGTGAPHPVILQKGDRQTFLLTSLGIQGLVSVTFLHRHELTAQVLECHSHSRDVPRLHVLRVKI